MDSKVQPLFVGSGSEKFALRVQGGFRSVTHTHPLPQNHLEGQGPRPGTAPGYRLQNLLGQRRGDKLDGAAKSNASDWLGVVRCVCRPSPRGQNKRAPGRVSPIAWRGPAKKVKRAGQQEKSLQLDAGQDVLPCKAEGQPLPGIS